MLKYFKIPQKPLTHPTVTLSGVDAKGEPFSKPFEFGFDLYIAALLADAWWKGDGNDNDAIARVDANFRIQDAFEAAEQDPDHVVALEDADLKWLIERARVYKPKDHLDIFAPKILRFYRVLLGASKNDPRPKPTPVEPEPAQEAN